MTNADIERPERGPYCINGLVGVFRQGRIDEHCALRSMRASAFGPVPTIQATMSPGQTNKPSPRRNSSPGYERIAFVASPVAEAKEAEKRLRKSMAASNRIGPT